MAIEESDLRRVPRRYPRALLNAVYSIEWLGRVVFRGKALYSRQLARDLRVRRERVATPRLPAAFDGLRIAHLSDFHAGPFLDARSLAPAIEALRALKPDVICLTGDFLTHDVSEGIALASAFEGVVARHGGFLVFGNHDYRRRREHEMATAFERVGIRALRNSAATIERTGADGRPSRIVIAGIEDVEEGKVVDLDAALAGRQDDDFTILLAHHPDVAKQVEGRRIDLMLSGHTHGGQIVCFGRSVFGGSLRSVFSVGLHRLGDMALSVTSGLGVLMLPLRVNAAPEIVLLELERMGE